MRAVALLLLLAAGCSGSVSHKAQVILVCFEQEANDGAVAENYKTTLEVLDTNHRMIWNGNFGNTGDVFTVYRLTGGTWSNLE